MIASEKEVSKPAHHKAPIIRLGEPRIHNNADTLELFDIGGYQVVVKKSEFKSGDLAVYVQPDSVVPQTEPFRFIWGQYAVSGFPEGVTTVPERRRRITVRRFRKEWSEGLLMQLSDFSHGIWNEGDDVSDILGIYHYDPPEPGDSRSTMGRRQQPKFPPKSLKGWWYWLLTILRFYPNGNVGRLDEKAPPTIPLIYDVDSYKNFNTVFEPGETVIVTEKIHGSNGRFTFQNKHMYAGSRQFWKRENATCIWRTVLTQHPEIEMWCRAHENYTLYVEVVPTQKEPFTYGCESGKTRYFMFDVLSPKGEWLTDDNPIFLSALYQLNHVPILYAGPFDEDKILSLADGKSMVSGAEKQIKEGIVIKALIPHHIHGLGRLQLKIPSNLYYEAIAKG